MRNLLSRVWRPLEILMGLLFLASAIAKTIQVNTFTVQIFSYGVIGDKSLLPAAALGTLLVEYALACALMLGLRLRGLTYGFLEALLAVFSGLILYGWFAHDLENCGCFGALEMSPAVSLSKNAALMAAGALMWAAFYSAGKPVQRAGFAAGKSAIAILAALSAAGFAFARLDPVVRMESDDPGETAPGPFAQFQFDTDQGAFDLGTGDHIVAMLSMNCDHCMEEVPFLNNLTLDPSLPPLVALCLEEVEGGLDEFVSFTGPLFPMHTVGAYTFFQFIGDAPPRVYALRNGRSLQHWDDSTPQPAEMQAVFAAGEEPGEEDDAAGEGGPAAPGN